MTSQGALRQRVLREAASLNERPEGRLPIGLRDGRILLAFGVGHGIHAHQVRERHVRFRVAVDGHVFL
jgi:hypothetical protein